MHIKEIDKEMGNEPQQHFQGGALALLIHHDAPQLLKRHPP